MEDNKEAILTDYPNVISYECSKKIITQMERNICKINIGKTQGTGFFCKIPFPNEEKMLPVLMTNNHVINDSLLNQVNTKIELDIKEEADLKEIYLNHRIKYTNKEYDITIIEIKEKDNINNYLELDDIIIDDILNNNNQNKEYEDKTIYIIQYPKGELSVSYGILSSITLDKIYNFNHKCSTEKGSSGSPILTFNNKVFGIHKKGCNNLNKGTFLNFPIKEFINLNHDNNNNINNNKNSIDDALDNFEEEANVIHHKIIFIGDYGTGKTEIINKLVSNEGNNDIYEASIGVDFMTKTIKYENRNIKFQIWDTSGHEKYRGLIPSYVRNSSLVFLIYDINSRESFEGLENWIKFIHPTEKTKIVICGNKLHLIKREVDENEGWGFAKKYGLSFFEIDSRNSIRSMFYNSIAELPIFKGKIIDKEKFVKEHIEEDNREVTEANNEKDNNNNNNNKDCFIY